MVFVATKTLSIKEELSINMDQKRVNEIAYEVVGCAIEVHRHLGPGLLESVYHYCLIEELGKSNLQFKSQVVLPIIYKGIETNQILKIVRIQLLWN